MTLQGHSLTTVLELLGQTNPPPLQVVHYVATFAAGGSSGPQQKNKKLWFQFCCDVNVFKQKRGVIIRADVLHENRGAGGSLWVRTLCVTELDVLGCIYARGYAVSNTHHQNATRCTAVCGCVCGNNVCNAKVANVNSFKRCLNNYFKKKYYHELTNRIMQWINTTLIFKTQHVQMILLNLPKCII